MDDFVMIDWIFNKDSSYDLRQTLVKCGEDGRYLKLKIYNRWTENLEWGPCHVNQISPVTNRPICYTTEANKYGQTSHYFALVVT